MALLAPGCVSAKGCLDDVPAALRADVARTALERGFLERDRMPEADFDLAITGTSDEFLPPERAAVVRRHALSYAHCVQDHLRVP